MQNIRSGRVGPVQEPCIGDSVRRQRMTSLHLADIGESVGLFRTGSIASGISASSVDNGSRLMLLLNQLGNVGGDFDVVIGMTNNNQNIDFITSVRLGIGFGLLGLRAWNSHQYDCKNKTHV